MKKRFGIAALFTATLILTGCTAPVAPSTPVVSPVTEEAPDELGEYWKEETATKDREEISKSIARGPEVRLANGRDEKCLQTVNVIGIGNPGTDNLVVTSVFEAIKAQVVKDVKNVDPDLVTLTIPTYAGSDMTTPKHSDLTDGSLDTERASAAKAVATAVRDAQDTCAGSKTVLLANGFGAAAIHEALLVMNPIAARSVSRIVLITDPNRSTIDPVDTLSVGDPAISKLDGVAAGKLSYKGIAGTELFDPVLHDRILSVCHPADSICNGDPSIPMGFTATGPGQQFVMNIALHEKAYVAPEVTSLIAGWVAEKTASDLEAAVNVRDSYADLTEYLKYVNRNNEGAKVIQDTPAPAAVTTCEADYAVFTTRGSGENIEGAENWEYVETKDNFVGYRGGQPAQNEAPVLQGLTKFPATLAWEITSKLPAEQTVRFIPVNYDAAPVPGIDEHSPSVMDYANSVNKGVAQLTSEITEFQEKCPETKIALIGYSQGAQVIHTTLSKLPEAVTEKINAVLLIADPIMNSALPNNGIRYDPTTDEGKGKFKKNPLAVGILVASFGNAQIPEGLGSKVVQICDKDDHICMVLSDNLARSMDVHSNAYSNERHYVPPANFAVEKLTGRKLLSEQQWTDINEQLDGIL